jgi:O-antigen/teichoic acid export membrane protein
MSQLPIFFLNWLSSSEEVGFFSAAQKVSAYATVPSAMLTASLYPVFCHLSESDRPRLEHLSGQTLRFMTLIAIPLAASGVIVGPWLMPILYGGGFEPASGPFGIMMVQSGLMYPGTTITLILVAMGRQRTVLHGVGVGAAASVVTCLALGQLLGAAGAASGLLAATVAAGIYLLVVLRRALGGDLQMREGRLLGVLGVLAVGTAIASSVLPLPAASIVGLTGCVAGAIILRAVDRADLQVFIDAVRVQRNRQNVGGGADGDRRL